MNRYAAAVAAAVLLAFAAPAQAAPISIDFAGTFQGPIVPQNPQDISQSTSFVFAPSGNWVVTNVGASDNTGVSFGQIVDLPKGQLFFEVGTAFQKTFTGSGGVTFTESLVITNVLRNNANFLNVLASGTATASGGSFSDAPVAFSLTLTQAGASISTSAAFSDASNPIPEPFSLGLLGAGLLGLGMVSRKKIGAALEG